MDLIAATHGRGVYRLDLAPLQRVVGEGGPWTDAMHETPTAFLPRSGDTLPRPRRASEERVPITFTLEQAGSVTLDVIDDEGATVWSREITGHVGLNQFLWDLVTERRSSPRPYFTGHTTFVAAGNYELRITGDEVLLTGALEVVAR